MFGYRAAEMIGRSIAPLVPPDQAAELSQIVDRVRLGRSMLQYETVRLRKDGRALCVQQTVSPVRDATGQVNAMVVISRDVSELKRLQSLVLETAEQVQRRIGQDLHDGLSQQLSGIAYLTHLLHRKLVSQSLPEAEEAQRIVELVTEASHQARSVARGLLPVKPEPNGLAVALRRLASTIERTYPLSCWALCEPNLAIPDATLATHLYRIAQEAAHNAVKHSQANEIVIHLKRSQGRLQLIIEDDGRGWRQGAEPRPGMGLETMKYRARAIGATLRWRPRNDRGVRLVCSLPMASAPSGGDSHAR
jgi:PAS domain S-box-containing protein